MKNKVILKSILSLSLTFCVLALVFIAWGFMSFGWFSNNIETTTTGMSVRTNAYGLELNLYDTTSTQINWETDAVFEDLTIPGTSEIIILEVINKSQNPITINDFRFMAPTSEEEIPVKDSNSYSLATASFDENEIYYTRSGAGIDASPYVFTVVQEPDENDLATYYIQNKHWFSSQLWCDMIFIGTTKPASGAITDASFSSEGYQIWTNETSQTSPEDFILRPENSFYSLTSDTSVVDGKTYCTRSGAGTNESPYVFTIVENPTNANIGTYYDHAVTLSAVGQSGSTYYYAIRILFKNLDSNQNVFSDFGSTANSDGTTPILKRRFYIDFDTSQ